MWGFDQKSISTTKTSARLVSLRAWKTLFKVMVLVLASCRQNTICNCKMKETCSLCYNSWYTNRPCVVL